MGKGEIISGGTDGQYTIKPDYDMNKLENEVSVLGQQKTLLEAKLPDLQAELDDWNDNIGQVIAELDTFEPIEILAGGDDFDQSKLDAYLDYRDDLQNYTHERDLVQSKLDWTRLEIVAIDKRKAKLEALQSKLESNTTAWCADLTEDLTGEVATVEVPNELNGNAIQIRPGYNDAAGYNSDRDGQLAPLLAQSPYGTFYNLAMLPGKQKFKPQYRYGTITAITPNDPQLATVELTTLISSQQAILINESATLTDVPADYMECDMGGFLVGDEVLIEFTGRDFDEPVIIGFKANPQKCRYKVIAVIEMWFEKGLYDTTSNPRGWHPYLLELHAQERRLPSWTLAWDIEKNKEVIPDGVETPALFDTFMTAFNTQAGSPGEAAAYTLFGKEVLAPLDRTTFSEWLVNLPVATPGHILIGASGTYGSETLSYTDDFMESLRYRPNWIDGMFDFSRGLAGDVDDGKSDENKVADGMDCALYSLRGATNLSFPGGPQPPQTYGVGGETCYDFDALDYTQGEDGAQPQWPAVLANEPYLWSGHPNALGGHWTSNDITFQGGYYVDPHKPMPSGETASSTWALQGNAHAQITAEAERVSATATEQTEGGHWRTHIPGTDPPEPYEGLRHTMEAEYSGAGAFQVDIPKLHWAHCEKPFSNPRIWGGSELLPPLGQFNWLLARDKTACWDGNVVDGIFLQSLDYPYNPAEYAFNEGNDEVCGIHCTADDTTRHFRVSFTVSGSSEFSWKYKWHAVVDDQADYVFSNWALAEYERTAGYSYTLTCDEDQASAMTGMWSATNSSSWHWAITDENEDDNGSQGYDGQASDYRPSWAMGSTEVDFGNPSDPQSAPIITAAEKHVMEFYPQSAGYWMDPEVQALSVFKAQFGLNIYTVGKTELDFTNPGGNWNNEMGGSEPSYYSIGASEYLIEAVSWFSDEDSGDNMSTINPFSNTKYNSSLRQAVQNVLDRMHIEYGQHQTPDGDWSFAWSAYHNSGIETKHFHSIGLLRYIPNFEIKFYRVEKNRSI